VTAPLPVLERLPAVSLAARRWLLGCDSHGAVVCWMHLVLKPASVPLDARLAAFWREHEQEVLRWHIRHWPGTRPAPVVGIQFARAPEAVGWGRIGPARMQWLYRPFRKRHPKRLAHAWRLFHVGDADRSGRSAEVRERGQISPEAWAAAPRRARAAVSAGLLAGADRAVSSAAQRQATEKRIESRRATSPLRIASTPTIFVTTTPRRRRAGR
jgi:hypothetical protein